MSFSNEVRRNTGHANRQIRYGKKPKCIETNTSVDFGVHRVRCLHLGLSYVPEGLESFHPVVQRPKSHLQTHAILDQKLRRVDKSQRKKGKLRTLSGRHYHNDKGGAIGKPKGPRKSLRVAQKTLTLARKVLVDELRSDEDEDCESRIAVLGTLSQSGEIEEMCPVDRRHRRRWTSPEVREEEKYMFYAMRPQSGLSEELRWE